MASETTGHRRLLDTVWCRAGAGLAVAVVSLVACTGSDPGALDASPEAAVTTTSGIICSEQAKAYRNLTQELSPDDFLSRVLDEDVARVRALLYPDGHPRAGQFIPVEEWGADQKSAWGVYVTTRGNWPVGMELC